METADKTKQWGGKRDGSGRKKTTVRTTSFRATEEVAVILDKVENKSDFINKAIESYYKLLVPAHTLEDEVGKQ